MAHEEWEYNFLSHFRENSSELSSHSVLRIFKKSLKLYFADHIKSDMPKNMQRPSCVEGHTIGAK